MHVLRGRVRVVADAVEWEGRDGDLLIVAQARHTLHALEDAAGWGSDSDLWTLRPIAVVIDRVTGVRHHPSHVWRILGQLGWKIARWVKQAGQGSAKRASARRVDRVPG